MNKKFFGIWVLLGLSLLFFIDSAQAVVTNATRYNLDFSLDANTTSQLTQTFFLSSNTSIGNNCTSLTYRTPWQSLTGNATKFRAVWRSNNSNTISLNISLNGGTNYVTNISNNTNYNWDYALPANVQTFGARITLGGQGADGQCADFSQLNVTWGYNLTRANTTPDQIIQNSNVDGRTIIDVNYTSSSGETVTYGLNDTARLGVYNIASATGVVNGSINVSNAGNYQITVYATAGETTNSTTFNYLLNNTAYRGVYGNLTPGGEQPVGATLTCDVGGTDDDLNSISYTWYRWYGNDAIVGTTSGRTYTANTPNEIVNCEGILWDGNLNSTGTNSSDTRISGMTGAGTDSGSGASVREVPRPAVASQPVTPVPSRPTAPSAPSQGSQAIVAVLNNFVQTITGLITGLINAITGAIGG